MKNNKLIIKLSLLIFLIFSCVVSFGQYTAPSIHFATELQASNVFDQLEVKTAFKIMKTLFWMALFIGGANVVRVFVFHPDKAKKVAINYIVGIIAFSVLSNFIGAGA